MFPWILNLFQQEIYSVSSTKTEHIVPALPNYISNAPLYAPNKSIFVVRQKGICYVETKIHKILNFLNPVWCLLKLKFGQFHGECMHIKADLRSRHLKGSFFFISLSLFFFNQSVLAVIIFSEKVPILVPCTMSANLELYKNTYYGGDSQENRMLKKSQVRLMDLGKPRRALHPSLIVLGWRNKCLGNYRDLSG